MRPRAMLGAFVCLGACARNAGSPAGETDTATDPESGKPVVVFWTVDTLGERAAADVKMCGALSAIFAAHGLDLGCVDGAVPTSTWTEESHLRMLWPQYQVGELQAREVPKGGTPTFLQTLAETRGLSYLFAADNATFARGDEEEDASWTQGADAAWVFQTFKGTVVADEEGTAVYAGMGDLLERTAKGEGIAAFLNDFDAGGHEPRCVANPDTEACSTVWQMAVELGYVEEDDKRAYEFYAQELVFKVSELAVEKLGDEPEVLRGLYWQTILEAIRHFRDERLETRVERLLSGLEEQGRLDDLVFVMAGDHGENPCIPMDVSGNVNCAHFGVPNEWTARVPVFVAPADVGAEWHADGYVGDENTPWSLSNVAFAVLDAEGVEAPSDWPAMMPVGTATSWVCHAGREAGTHIEGDVSLRCEDESCETFDWAYPAELTYEPQHVADLPPGFDDLAAPTNGKSNAFVAACAGVGGF